MQERLAKGSNSWQRRFQLKHMHNAFIYNELPGIYTEVSEMGMHIQFNLRIQYSVVYYTEN